MVLSRFNDSLGCRPAWFDLKELKVCQDEGKLWKARMIFDEVAHQVDRICKNPCHFLNLRTGARNWAPYPNNYIFVYFPYKVQITKESYLATGLSIIADIGGTASLLLGVSFFHIAKLAVTLFDLKIKESDDYLGPFHLQAQWPISCLLYIVMCTDPSDFWLFSFVFYSVMCTN